MKKVFRKNNLILFLSLSALVTLFAFLFMTQGVYAKSNSNIDSSNSDSIFYWGWWLIGIVSVIVFIIVKEILFYHFRLGIYGDVKMKKEMEQKLVSKATAKKPTYTQNPEVCSVLAGNKTVEIDTQTCLLKDRKRKREGFDEE